MAGFVRGHNDQWAPRLRDSLSLSSKLVSFSTVKITTIPLPQLRFYYFCLFKTKRNGECVNERSTHQIQHGLHAIHKRGVVPARATLRRRDPRLPKSPQKEVRFGLFRRYFGRNVSSSARKARNRARIHRGMLFYLFIYFSLKLCNY